MDVLQLGFGLIVGFVGVVKPVVFGGVVKHPVGAPVPFGVHDAMTVTVKAKNKSRSGSTSVHQRK